MSRCPFRCLPLAAIFWLCASAQASNLNFLKDTPVSWMKPADRQALNRAAQNALETKKDGETSKWSNEGTGNPVHIEGTVTPRDTQTQDGNRCRQVTLVAIAKGQKQSWTPTACKSADGVWKIRKR